MQSEFSESGATPRFSAITALSKLCSCGWWCWGLGLVLAVRWEGSYDDSRGCLTRGPKCRQGAGQPWWLPGLRPAPRRSFQGTRASAGNNNNKHQSGIYHVPGLMLSTLHVLMHVILIINDYSYLQMRCQALPSVDAQTATLLMLAHTLRHSPCARHRHSTWHISGICLILTNIMN